MPESTSSAGARAGLALLTGGTVAIGCAYAAAIVLGTAPRWAEWLLALGAAATPVGLFALGAVTRNVLARGVGVLLAMLFVALFASFAAGLAIPPSEGPGGRLLFGLPLRLAIVFYGVGFVPLLALPLTFAATFRDGAARGRGDAAGHTGSSAT